MKRILSICIAGLFLTVCLYSYARGQNIGDKIATTGENYEMHLHKNSYIFKSFYAKYANMTISNADKANGVDATYCVALTYVYQHSGRPENWRDGSDALIYKLKNGRFEISNARSNYDCWYWCQQKIKK